MSDIEAEPGGVDVEDISTIAEMQVLGAQYIAEQDEPDEAGNVVAMHGVLDTLAGLMVKEVNEVEPPEVEDD